MSIKLKAGAIALTSLAAIEAARQQAAALTLQINEAEAGLKAKTEADIKAEVESSRVRIGKILGREFTMGELLPVVSAVVNDKPLFATPTTRTGPVALSEDQRAKLKAAMLGRAADLKLGKTPTPISVICTGIGCSTQTAPNYRPTAAEVAALPGDKEVPATAIATA